MKKALNPATTPTSLPFYSQGVEVSGASRLVLVSGQVGVTADGAVREGIEAQAQQAFENLNAVVAEAGLTPADIVKLTIYLTDPDNLGAFLGAAAASLTDDPPATTMLFVSQLSSPELLVEIEATAAA
jgi:enamine deaminase RidA (YjgF/YER057c/UK114 family)